MNILSIQSHVAYGHVGNSAATFALQRLGHEVWSLPTVLFSNHPAHGGFGGEVTSPELITAMVDGLANQGFLASTDAVLSGYLGAPENGAALLQAVEKARGLNAGLTYLCDPVIGHAGRGVFAADGIAELFRSDIIPQADIVTPSQFELEWLCDCKIGTLADAVAAARKLQAQGPKVVLCTSLQRVECDEVETLLVTPTAAWVVSTPHLAGEMFGAGDLFAALYLGHRMIAGDTPDVLTRAVSATYAVLQQTAQAGGGELALIAAQDQLLTPAQVFPARNVI